MPGFNLNRFIAKVNERGIQKTNKFLLRFDTVPSFLLNNATNLTLSNAMTARAKATGQPFADRGDFPPGSSPPLNVTANTSTQYILNSMEYWVQTVAMSGAQIATRQLNRYGYYITEKKPFNVLFNDITFTVVGDGQGINWQFFVDWLNTVIRYDASNGINPQTDIIAPGEVFYKTDYISNIRIITFNDAGNVTSQIVLREAYPISMGDLPLNWGDNNNILRIPITFTFLDWYPDTTEV